MANPFPFSSGDILTAAELNQIGEWTSYTPTWQGLTVGNGALTFNYAQVNDVVHVQFRVTLGSTSVVSGGGVIFSLPTSTAGYVGYHSLGVAAYYDVGTAVYLGHAVYWTTDRCYLRVGNSGGTYLSSSGIGPTVPFTFTTGDQIMGEISYRAA